MTHPVSAFNISSIKTFSRYRGLSIFVQRIFYVLFDVFYEFSGIPVKEENKGFHPYYYGSRKHFIEISIVSGFFSIKEDLVLPP